ncbi:amino acid ABC transporter membrane protein 2 (PAAT family) [Stella humosa]|uniref:Amino acid ABC transporter membrane protein 2 (PAAT family) n=1 Tax=Stella humosa TaxID=94 RepID=A0A3N1KPL4_9PROT|nr:amino acid ABC transporter permease [Stella humosa]ROP81287.1 amino acid ABC transporter membrane protein 2 (PAAT family) [Stella humosa]BBK32636.1 amino acid ABC transporter permease [Stella humosa]
MTVSDLGLPPAAVRAGPVRVGRWVWRNLFATIPNTLITLLLLWLLASTVPGVVRWLFVDALWAPATAEQCLRGAGACWAFLQAKYRLILFGPYPYDEQWRPALAMLLFFAMVVATCFPELFRLAGRMRRLLVAWVATVGAITWLLHGGLGLSLVEVRLWGGLPLTLILSVVGAFCAFWLAIFLALGRRSHMPVVRALAIGYIELIRGVPLIGLLFMAVVLFPLIVPPGVDVDKLARAQIAFILFFAAYMAEAIRGGLQAIPAGQYEAAGALGLGYWPTMRFVVLPQALRIVIPTLVNIFIGAFKDTSLVLIIAMFDLLGSANAAKSDSTWWGLYVEAYLFVASIYLVFCALMSAYSQRLERRLGAGRG